MDNRQIAETETVAAVVAAEAVQEMLERYPNRFKPGKSGNPAGRPKKTNEEEALLDRLKNLTPMALEQMEKMLKSDRMFKPFGYSKTSADSLIFLCPPFLSVPVCLPGSLTS